MRRTIVVALALAIAIVGVEVMPSAASSSRSVTIGDDFFKPTKLTVSKGTRVTWHWRGSDTHNVTVSSGPTKFHSRDRSSGSFARTLRRAGTYRILCTIHGFRMKIVVR